MNLFSTINLAKEDVLKFEWFVFLSEILAQLYFQGVSFMLAEMAMNLELSRLMTYRSSYELMMGRPGSYYSSIAKCFAADTANLAATNAVQIFGG